MQILCVENFRRRCRQTCFAKSSIGINHRNDSDTENQRYKFQQFGRPKSCLCQRWTHLHSAGIIQNFLVNGFWLRFDMIFGGIHFFSFFAYFLLFIAFQFIYSIFLSVYIFFSINTFHSIPLITTDFRFFFFFEKNSKTFDLGLIYSVFRKKYQFKWPNSLVECVHFPYFFLNEIK